MAGEGDRRARAPRWQNAIAWCAGLALVGLFSVGAARCQGEAGWAPFGPEGDIPRLLGSGTLPLLLALSCLGRAARRLLSGGRRAIPARH